MGNVGVFDRWPSVAGSAKEGGRRVHSPSPSECAQDSPLISIVTIGRNPGADIRRTVGSVRRQSFKNIEHIVVDGDSSDGTIAWLRDNDDLIDYWMSEPDAGIYDAMNKGLMLAKGSIIGLLNCGDEYTSDCCEIVARRIPAARSHEAIILSGGMERTDERRGLSFWLPATRQRFFDRITHGMPLNHPATFVTAAAYRAVGLFDPSFRLCGDYDFIYRAFRRGGVRFEFAEEKLAIMPMGGVSERLGNLWTRAKEHYRIRSGSMGKLHNLLNCGQLIAVNGLKFAAKAHVSSAMLRFYYRGRHPRQRLP